MSGRFIFTVYFRRWPGLLLSTPIFYVSLLHETRFKTGTSHTWLWNMLPISCRVCFHRQRKGIIEVYPPSAPSRDTLSKCNYNFIRGIWFCFMLHHIREERWFSRHKEIANCSRDRKLRVILFSRRCQKLDYKKRVGRWESVWWNYERYRLQRSKFHDKKFCHLRCFMKTENEWDVTIASFFFIPVSLYFGVTSSFPFQFEMKEECLMR